MATFHSEVETFTSRWMPLQRQEIMPPIIRLMSWTRRVLKASERRWTPHHGHRSRCRSGRFQTGGRQRLRCLRSRGSREIDGWRALLAAVNASGRDVPEFACCFTSVAGRFGNGGQTDYAAANSVLDAEMARLTATTGCRGVAIGWTGWRDVGMATRGSIEAVFAAAGIETLSVEDGVSIFVGEALRGGKRRVLGCGSLGLMDQHASFREAPLMLPRAWPPPWRTRPVSLHR